MDKILISGCLTGLPVRYDGQAKPLASSIYDRWVQEDRLVVVCPEILGGLTTPRAPAEIQKDQSAEDVLTGKADIIDIHGNKVTEAFLRGAHIALKIAKENNCKYAILTDASPTCGSDYIYDGHFKGNKILGKGIFAALLLQNDIEVFSQYKIEGLDKELR